MTNEEILFLKLYISEQVNNTNNKLKDLKSLGVLPLDAEAINYYPLRTMESIAYKLESVAIMIEEEQPDLNERVVKLGMFH
jgi:hypothetical protein